MRIWKTGYGFETASNFGVADFLFLCRKYWVFDPLKSIRFSSSHLEIGDLRMNSQNTKCYIIGKNINRIQSLLQKGISVSTEFYTYVGITVYTYVLGSNNFSWFPKHTYYFFTEEVYKGGLTRWFTIVFRGTTVVNDISKTRELNPNQPRNGLIR